MTAIRLVVSSPVSPEGNQEYVFDRERITIGRSSENRLTLPDENRIVSKKHAEVRREGGQYVLVDRGSKNFTYLNDERLTAGESYPLETGDTVRIGDFEIRLEEVRQQTFEEAQTVIDARFANPFEDQVDELAKVLGKIQEQFEDEAPNRRREALEMALEQRFNGDHRRAVESVIADFMGQTGRAGHDNDEVSNMSGGESDVSESTSTSASVSRQSASDHVTTAAGSDEQLDRVIDTLLDALSKVVDIPSRFRYEFIGQTIMRSSESAFLYDGDLPTLRSKLLDPTLSDDLLDERLTIIREAAEDLKRHQIAMLDGYKASAQKGSRKLLEVINPETVQEELAEETSLFRLIPVLAIPLVVQRLQQRCEELRTENWSVAERRMYRPTFVKAYLSRMTSQQHDSLDSGRP